MTKCFDKALLGQQLIPNNQKGDILIMKKYLALILVAVMLISIFTACGSSSSEDASSGDSAASESQYGEGFEFKHGYDKDFPPYSFIGDDGETIGLDVELAKAVCEYYGWTYTGVPINWDSKEAELESGSIDCIWSGFTKNPAREPKFSWSEPYSLNTIKVMVLEDSDIATMEDLAGKKVGVQTATSAQELMETPESEGGALELAGTFASTDIYDTYTIAINDLKAGAIDAIAIDETTGTYQMDKVEGLKFLDGVMCEEVYAIGFRTGDTELRDMINAALEALAADGTMDTIGKKYEQVYDKLIMINQ